MKTRSLALGIAVPLVLAGAAFYASPQLRFKVNNLVSPPPQPSLTIFEAAEKDDVVQIAANLHWLKTPVETRNANGNTPLCHAVTFGSTNAAMFLLDRGADIRGLCDQRPPNHSAAILEVAFEHGHHGWPQRIHMIRLLLDRGADPSQTNTYGQDALRTLATTLVVAGQSSSGLAEEERALLERYIASNADAQEAMCSLSTHNVRSFNGQNRLTEIVELLTSDGASPEQCDADIRQVASQVEPTRGPDSQTVRLERSVAARPTSHPDLSLDPVDGVYECATYLYPTSEAEWNRMASEGLLPNAVIAQEGDEARFVVGGSAVTLLAIDRGNPPTSYRAENGNELGIAFADGSREGPALVTIHHGGRTFNLGLFGVWTCVE